jgi:hypothetical protein
MKPTAYARSIGTFMSANEVVNQEAVKATNQLKQLQSYQARQEAWCDLEPTRDILAKQRLIVFNKREQALKLVMNEEQSDANMKRLWNIIHECAIIEQTISLMEANNLSNTYAD